MQILLIIQIYFDLFIFGKVISIIIILFLSMIYLNLSFNSLSNTILVLQSFNEGTGNKMTNQKCHICSFSRKMEAKLILGCLINAITLFLIFLILKQWSNCICRHPHMQEILEFLKLLTTLHKFKRLLLLYFPFSMKT